MNVAIHLKYNGFDPLLISKVGNDQLGNQLLEFVKGKGLKADFIQISEELETGVVIANVTDRQDVTYEIKKPVAWDFIEVEDAVLGAVEESRCVIYGSLATRTAVSQESLYRILEKSKTKVFDVNFRTPHYSKRNIHMLLKQADILKMNFDEMVEVVSWYEPYRNEEQGMELLKNLFHLELVIVTRGENGAAVVSREGFFEQRGFRVNVVDTIGSGDAFLATYLAGYFSDAPVEECLEKACKAGALVATKSGATPFIEAEEIKRLV